MSKINPGWPLRHPDTGECIVEHEYYVRLRTEAAWRIPVLYGRPPKGASADTDSERGVLALFLLLLFRPHRQVRDLFGSAAAQFGAADTRDAAWARLYKEYQC